MPNKEYYQKHKEKCKKQFKEWYQNNKEKIRQYNKEWYEKNIEYKKQYNRTDNAKKSNRINNWKERGIETDDYDFLHDWYKSIDNCLNCGIELVQGTGLGNQKHLDHCHKTGEPCMVVCGNCNVRILK